MGVPQYMKKRRRVEKIPSVTIHRLPVRTSEQWPFWFTFRFNFIKLKVNLLPALQPLKPAGWDPIQWVRS